VQEPLLQAFPFPRGYCTHVVRPACLFTVHVGGGSSPLSCEVFLPLPLSQAFLLLITGQCCCSCQPPYLFTVHVGSGSSLLSCRVFLPLPCSPAFPLLVAGHVPHSRSHQRLSGPPSLFIYSLFTVPGRIPFPQSSALSVPHPLSCMSLLLLLLITQFLFFSPGGGQSVQEAMLLSQASLWEYHSTTKLTWSASSQAIWAPATGGPGALLVSPFNLKWRFSALAGGVEESKLCLFSVIMPAKCVSSVSKRFHYRRLTFCFLPLAAILESFLEHVLKWKCIRAGDVAQWWSACMA
jgi:hypothetical protein